MVRYPYKIEITWKGEPVLNESTGNSTPGADVVKEIECNIITNTSEKTITANDGNTYVYSFDIYAPQQTFIAPFGANVEISKDGNVIFTNTLKGMFNLQSGTRIWV